MNHLTLFLVVMATVSVLVTVTAVLTVVLPSVGS